MLAHTWTLAAEEEAVRRRNARRLLEVLATSNGRAVVQVIAIPGAEPGYLRLPVLVSPKAQAVLGGRVARRLGVMPGYPGLLCDLPGFGTRCVNAAAAFPGARTLSARLFTLPTHSRLSEADLGQLDRLLESVSKSVS